MGLWFCFPRLRRCCFCTRKIRVACVLISVFIMFVGAHAFAMFMIPACEDIFDEDNEGDREIFEPLLIIVWVFFGWTILLLVSNFFFLLAIFKMPRQCWRYVARDFLVFCGLVWAGLAIALADLEMLQMVNCDCVNHSDIIACFVYAPLMMYYMIIVNSYKDLKGENDTRLGRITKAKVEKIPKEPTTKLGKCIRATKRLFGRIFSCKRKGEKKEKKPKTPKPPKSSKKPKPPKPPKTAKVPKPSKPPKSPKKTKPTKSPKPPKLPKVKKDKKPKNKDSDTKTAVTPVPAATPEAMDTAAVTPTDATALAPEDASALSPEMVPSALPPEKEPTELSPEKVPTENLPSALPPEKDPSALPPQRVPSVLPPHRASLISPPERTEPLTLDDIKTLKPESVSSLSPATVKAIKFEDIKLLSPDCIRELNPGQINALTAKHIQALTPKQINAFKPEQLRALRPEHVKAFTPEQLRSFSPENYAILPKII